MATNRWQTSNACKGRGMLALSTARFRASVFLDPTATASTKLMWCYQAQKSSLVLASRKWLGVFKPDLTHGLTRLDAFFEAQILQAQLAKDFLPVVALAGSPVGLCSGTAVFKSFQSLLPLLCVEYEEVNTDLFILMMSVFQNERSGCSGQSPFATPLAERLGQASPSPKKRPKTSKDIQCSLSASCLFVVYDVKGNEKWKCFGSKLLPLLLCLSLALGSLTWGPIHQVAADQNAGLPIHVLGLRWYCLFCFHSSGIYRGSESCILFIFLFLSFCFFIVFSSPFEKVLQILRFCLLFSPYLDSGRRLSFRSLALRSSSHMRRRSLRAVYSAMFQLLQVVSECMSLAEKPPQELLFVKSCLGSLRPWWVRWLGARLANLGSHERPWQRGPFIEAMVYLTFV